MATMPEFDTDTAAGALDDEHLSHFRLAVGNVLATASAQDAFAQIFDGLPTIQTWETFLPPMRSHPIYELNHSTTCEAALEKIEEFGRTFDAGRQLQFRRQLLHAFNAVEVGSPEFDLRLVEMAAVACHSIAAHLFKMDAGVHRRKVHMDWFASQMQIQLLSQRYSYSVPLPITPFHHRAYTAFEQYPDGEADIVGYWAECMIFGGVVVFDRGKSDSECNAVYFHDGRDGGPFTLYPPTDDQLRALLAFLKSPPGQDNPLPILASDLNRYRWDPYYAMKDHHIFRDRYERYNTEGHKSTWRWGFRHWPELYDQQVLLQAALHHVKDQPGPDEDEVKAAEEGLKKITPTSPVWHNRQGQTHEGQQAADRRLIEASLDRHIGVASGGTGHQ
ncbi:hypothetical protein GGTG_13234 [Gaeumannomyces tritici R3-111a-1]|uniref:Uncharacterized protein n=1 Tax=Gaeumannomyces tritici (strain R3-111a-1) TaxID=644352 RepID=J3PIA6_GAET3|nr:hypothetical protein GGTG_13234 [Gaeumannomyces tritici R3-111a-1]EJT69124.1 hypothetical protein GGTG_13234 [Gaeumannomyces tritici R3-111a-1]